MHVLFTSAFGDSFQESYFLVGGENVSPKSYVKSRKRANKTTDKVPSIAFLSLLVVCNVSTLALANVVHDK